MIDFNEKIEKFIEDYKEEMLEDLSKLIAIPSTYDALSICENAPFGMNVRKVFDEFLEIACRCGFQGKDYCGYACHASYLDGDDYIGILGHLDVVEAGDRELWDHDPFTLHREKDMLMARGVNDDKGPLLAALYAARILKDMGIPFKRPLRIIAGGAEETTWECMKYYFSKNKQPLMGFSPDGNFPIVNGEKGILQFRVSFPKCLVSEKNNIKSIMCKEEINYVCEEVKIHLTQLTDELPIQTEDFLKDEYEQEVILTFKGRSALSRNPQRGDNALWKLAQTMKKIPFGQKGMNDVLKYLNEFYTNDYYGKKAGVFYEDQDMGRTSLCPMSLLETDTEYILNIDYRYVKNVDIEVVKEYFNKQAEVFGASFSIIKEKKLLFVPEDSSLIRSLKIAYEKVMKEPAQTFSKGGASYARTMSNGVAFGATFEGENPRPHMPNEQMSITSLMMACKIYIYAIYELNCK